MSYLLFNIGCIECGVSSNIVGVYESESEAVTFANELNASGNFTWREGGQNSYEVFEIPTMGKINPEYLTKPNETAQE